LLLDELREEAEWNLDNFTEEWMHEEPEDRPKFLSLAGRAADEIERLRADNERLRKTYSHQAAYIEDLEGAAEFYADRKNWTGSRAYTGCLVVPVDEDRGKIARFALHTEDPSARAGSADSK
jgi:hypothetical protein